MYVYIYRHVYQEHDHQAEEDQMKLETLVVSVDNQIMPLDYLIIYGSNHPKHRF